MIYCRLGEYGSFYNWRTLANHDGNEVVAKKKKKSHGQDNISARAFLTLYIS